MNQITNNNRWHDENLEMNQIYIFIWHLMNQIYLALNEIEHRGGKMKI